MYQATIILKSGHAMNLRGDNFSPEDMTKLFMAAEDLGGRVVLHAKTEVGGKVLCSIDLREVAAWVSVELGNIERPQIQLVPPQQGGRH